MTRPTSSASAASLPPPKERQRLREAKSMSERQPASAIGVTRATVTAWESGRAAPHGRELEAYARLLAEAAAEGEETREAPEAREREETEETREIQETQKMQDTDEACETDAAEESQGSHEPEQSEQSEQSQKWKESKEDEPPLPELAPDSVAVAAAIAARKPRPLTPEQAFDALYAYAAPALVHQTYLLTGRRRLSRESVEYAFHLAWQRWPEVAVDRDPAGWVRAAAHEYAMSPWHRFRRTHRHPDSPPTAPDRRELLMAILDLPPSYRRTLLLYDGLGMNLPDMAAETEASTPAAAKRLLHARQAVAQRLPELTRPEALHRRLSALAAEAPTATIPPARVVRTGSERRTRLWTRAAICLTVVIIGATAFTVATAPTAYLPPLAPPEAVGGVPVRSGPDQLTKEDELLRKKLREEPMNGPERLVPDPR